MPYNMEPNLLMRTWMMAHLHGAEYQAVVCCCGSSGEDAFQESLEPQFMSPRHDEKGLHTMYITGTCGGCSISRIASGFIGREVVGFPEGPMCITAKFNATVWNSLSLSENQHLVSLTWVGSERFIIDFSSNVRI